jgi:hypothetical protein
VLYLTIVRESSPPALLNEVMLNEVMLNEVMLNLFQHQHQHQHQYLPSTIKVPEIV